MGQQARQDWRNLRRLALDLRLPQVADSLRSCGPCLLAHGTLWTWWDDTMDAPGVCMPRREREFLIAAEPDIFFITPELRPYNQVMARPDLVSAGWMQAHLMLSWRALAPKLFVELFPGEGPPVPSFSQS